MKVFFKLFFVMHKKRGGNKDYAQVSLPSPRRGSSNGKEKLI
jgi:hypothetical protein